MRLFTYVMTHGPWRCVYHCQIISVPIIHDSVRTILAAINWVEDFKEAKIAFLWSSPEGLRPTDTMLNTSTFRHFGGDCASRFCLSMSIV